MDNSGENGLMLVEKQAVRAAQVRWSTCAKRACAFKSGSLTVASDRRLAEEPQKLWNSKKERRCVRTMPSSVIELKDSTFGSLLVQNYQSGSLDRGHEDAAILELNNTGRHPFVSRSFGRSWRIPLATFTLQRLIHLYQLQSAATCKADRAIGL